MSTETEWHTINVSKCLLIVVAIQRNEVQSQAKYTQKIPGKLQLHKKEQRRNTAVGDKKTNFRNPELRTYDSKDGDKISYSVE
jgi:hypothetical protein